MKTIIAGSRDIIDYDFVKDVINSCPWEITEVVSGGATGVDTLGEKWAGEKGIAVRKFPAEWDKWGRSAGPLRNTQMADYADALVLVWDGISQGSGHMLEIALKRGLTLHCRKYQK